MPISNSLKNKKQNGFTILECILAVAILSSVLGSLVAIQTSIIYVAQSSMDKLKASWVLRQTMSQMNYILDAGGLDGISETGKYTWSGDNRFQVEISRKNLNDVKPSQFFVTALQIFNSTNPDGNENSNVQMMLAPITQFLDNLPPSFVNTNENKAILKKADGSNYVNVFLKVSWSMGSSMRSMEDGLFLMDNSSLANANLPL